MLHEGILANHPNLLGWFFVLVIALLGLDLFILRRGSETPTMRQSVLWCLAWIGIAMAFNVWVGLYLGWPAATVFLTGYIVELSLSVDNLFVFILIFSSFRIEQKYQHRVLFWGILGALGMRALCIAAGVSALQRFEWLEFVFAAILIWAGTKSLFTHDLKEEDPATGKLAQCVRRFIPIKNDYVGNRFFIKLEGRIFATPLFLVLILVEVSDVIFAVDSIPAVLAVTKDPYLVYSSNIFAILGLRNLYFVLSSLVQSFRFLAIGVSLILIFIGLKMAVSRWIHLPTEWTLGAIVGILAGSIALSLIYPPKSINDAL
ncbi:MAG: TerC family protein [Proteobacteria bacterium]|nr:TerC family protein [Pseudomonadota bacterium]